MQQKLSVKLFVATALALSLFALASCGTAEVRSDKALSAEPTSGTYNYDVFINDEPVGSVIVKQVVANGIVSVDSETKMSMRGIEMISTDSVHEKIDFTPIDCSFTSITRRGSFTTKTTFSAKANGKTIITNDDGEENTVETDGNYHFSDNILGSLIVKAGLKKGSTASALVYKPSLNPTKPVEMKAEITGTAVIKNNGVKRTTYICRTTLNGKNDIISYVGEDGINYIIEMNIMSLKMKMVLK